MAIAKYLDGVFNYPAFVLAVIVPAPLLTTKTCQNRLTKLDCILAKHLTLSSGFKPKLKIFADTMSDELIDLITPAEAARIRGVTRQTISQLIARERFKTKTVGGRLFLYRSEVESFEPDKGGRPPKAKAKPSKKKDNKEEVQA